MREKPAGASVFSRIFSNMEVRGTLYILKDIREYGVKAKSQCVYVCVALTYEHTHITNKQLVLIKFSGTDIYPFMASIETDSIKPLFV